MSKYEEMTLILVIGLCIAVVFAFKKVKDKEEEITNRLDPLIKASEKFFNEEKQEDFEKAFVWAKAWMAKLPV